MEMTLFSVEKVRALHMRLISIVCTLKTIATSQSARRNFDSYVIVTSKLFNWGTSLICFSCLEKHPGTKISR